MTENETKLLGMIKEFASGSDKAILKDALDELSENDFVEKLTNYFKIMLSNFIENKYEYLVTLDQFAHIIENGVRVPVAQIRKEPSESHHRSAYQQNDKHSPICRKLLQNIISHFTKSLSLLYQTT